MTLSDDFNFSIEQLWFISKIQLINLIEILLTFCPDLFQIKKMSIFGCARCVLCSQKKKKNIDECCAFGKIAAGIVILA